MRLIHGASGLLLLISLTISLTGCGGSSRERESEPLKKTQLSMQEAEVELARLEREIFIDPLMTEREKGFLGYDYRKMTSWQIRNFQDSSVTVSNAYRKVFGSLSASPTSYIYKRISALFSSTRAQGGTERTVATNTGFGIWIAEMLKGNYNPKPVVLGTQVIRLDSSRAGIVTLGNAYSQVDSSVFRVSTFVHESRHSDCPEGVTELQLDELKEPGGVDRMNEILRTCGFAHILCPPGHDLEDLPACEIPTGWGAYAVEALFAKALYTSCTNCTETEKEQALATYVDSVGRLQRDSTTQILPEDFGRVWKSMSNGQYGLPDMRQQGFRSW